MKRASSFLALALAALAWLSFTSAAVAQPQAKAPPAPDWSPAVLAGAAQAALDEGQDYDAAIKLLREAISMNPDDAGAKYDPTAFHQQRTDLPDHGVAQVRSMLRNRRSMAAYLAPSDDLWKWTAWKYGVRIGKNRVRWDPSPTSNLSTEAEHSIPFKGADGKIRVRNGSPTQKSENRAETFENLWSSAIYELHNIEGAAEFLALNEQAESGAISKDEFVKGMFLVEFRAAQRTRKCYVEVYLPHAKKNKIKTSPDNWFCDGWWSAESQLALYTDKDWYPWVPYSAYYADLRSRGEKTAQKKGLPAAAAPDAAVVEPAEKEKSGAEEWKKYESSK